MRNFLIAWLAASSAACGGPGPSVAAPGGAVAIAAASDLRFALDEVVTAFQQEHPGAMVTPTYGSSGNFYAQLVNGAPFDLYLSADISYPRQLGDRGLTLPGTDFKYAEGRIAVWVPNGSPLAVEARGLEALLDPSVRHIAIANPEHAPYGRAAVAALTAKGMMASVEAKLVLGENVSQTLQFVQSRSADVGIIALSLAVAPAVKPSGRYFIVPADAHPAIEQGGAIMKSTRSEALARAFRAHLLGPGARAVLERYGFTVPRG